jgi:hypothetical protein
MAISNQSAGTREKAADRRVRALDLRKSGAGYRQIANTLAVSVSQAHDDVQIALQALAKLEQASAEEYRAMELARLDMALLALASKMKLGDPAVVNAWVRVSESRRKLLGLDAPQAIDVQGALGQQQIIGVVLNLLAPYPELKLLLAEQLDQVIDANDVDPAASGA